MTRQSDVSLWIVGSYRCQRFGLLEVRHGFMRFAPSLAALFERSVVQKPLTSRDRFEPTILMTLRSQPVLVGQEQVNSPYAAIRTYREHSDLQRIVKFKLRHYQIHPLKPKDC